MREWIWRISLPDIERQLDFFFLRTGSLGSTGFICASSLSDLKNRSENSAGRVQILTLLQVNSRSIDQKSGEI